LSNPNAIPAGSRHETPAANLRGRSARAAAFALLAAFMSPFVAAPAHAWSAPGHRIVGLVAEQFLDGDTRRALYQIAGEESLAEIGLWLDEQRDRLRTEWPGSERWHYDNRPVCDPSTPFASRCAQGDCPTAAIDRHLRVLADPDAPRERRLDALRVVVHVLADVHQPLHAGDNRDRGGNDINVDMGPRREPRSLHGIWDRQVVEYAMRGESERAFARQLARENRRDVRRLQSGSLTDWMEESYVYARNFVYPGVPSFACGQTPPFVVRLDDEYRREAARIARERLARAGIRLAGVLNEALGR
jgi:hypothetical protein